MRCVSLLVHIGTLCGLLLLVVYQGGMGFATETQTEISISARCDPHSEVINPSGVSVRMDFSSTATGPTATAWMTTRGTVNYDATSTTPHWETPTKGWVSFVFEGPPLSSHYYCQTDWSNKPLHLSYDATPNIRLFLSQDGNTSSREFDTLPTGTRSMLSLTADETKTSYSAGHNSNNPFWIQIAIPVYNTGLATTVLRNDFM